MKFFSLLFCLLISGYSYSQKTCITNEVVAYSFKTSKGMTCSLTKDKDNKYLVYRYGTKDNIELEFPEKNSDSWKQFTYSFYLRGGSTQNEGMDLNYVAFIHKNYKYVIYETYSAVDNKQSIGIKLINLTTHKTTVITGLEKTKNV